MTFFTKGEVIFGGLSVGEVTNVEFTVRAPREAESANTVTGSFIDSNGVENVVEVDYENYTARMWEAGDTQAMDQVSWWKHDYIRQMSRTSSIGVYAQSLWLGMRSVIERNEQLRVTIDTNNGLTDSQ